jgi:hypothetical protein
MNHEKFSKKHGFKQKNALHFTEALPRGEGWEGVSQGL